MSEKKFDINDAPRLGDWVGLAEAGHILGVTRQYAHKLAHRGKFATLHKLGETSSYVVSEQEVLDLKHKRTVDEPSQLGEAQK